MLVRRLLKTAALLLAVLHLPAQAADKPNILVIWGDDIGITNISAYSDGIMGYRTPNIDRIANEGIRFTDYYGDQSCTAGRSSFITGQSPLRTGLSKVGTSSSGDTLIGVTATYECGAGTRFGPSEVDHVSWTLTCKPDGNWGVGNESLQWPLCEDPSSTLVRIIFNRTICLYNN